MEPTHAEMIKTPTYLHTTPWWHTGTLIYWIKHTGSIVTLFFNGDTTYFPVKDGENVLKCYSFLNDLLRMRQLLGITVTRRTV